MIKRYILTDVVSKRFNLHDDFICYIPDDPLNEDDGIGWSEDIGLAVQFDTYEEAEEKAIEHGILKEVVIEDFWVR